jgi:hypothetical protein
MVDAGTGGGDGRDKDGGGMHWWPGLARLVGGYVLPCRYVHVPRCLWVSRNMWHRRWRAPDGIGRLAGSWRAVRAGGMGRVKIGSWWTLVECGEAGAARCDMLLILPEMLMLILSVLLRGILAARDTILCIAMRETQC